MPRIVRDISLVFVAALLLPPLLWAQERTAAPLLFKPIEVPQGSEELLRDVANARLRDEAFSDWRELPEVDSVNNTIDTTLLIDYTTTVFNGKRVKLRTYYDPTTQQGWVTGPTLRFKAGDRPRTLKVNLRNALPCEPGMDCKCVNSCADIAHDHGTHACGVAPHKNVFNATNLHTHGLHVSPECPQDNVFLKLNPRCSFPVKVDIPAGHVPGTFWYHAHWHGATAIQLASGMAGALIIEGKLDEALRQKGIAERLFVLQQISYNNAGVLETFDDLGIQGDDPSLTSVNGQIKPKITLNWGQIERWRLLDAGIDEVLPLRLYKNGKFYDFHLVAIDGITIGPKPRPLPLLELAPGYRADVLVQFMEPGTYTLVKTSGQFQSGEIEPSQVIAVIEVEEVSVPMTMPQDLPVEAPPPIPEPVTPRTPVVFSAKSGQFLIDDKCYPDVRFKAKLDTAEEWKISNTSNIDHPFHIHVNPFQVTAISLDGKTEIPIPPGDRVWRDTFLIPRRGYFKMQTHYTKFTGKFVLHCHFLNHEDLGMMAGVTIEP